MHVYSPDLELVHSAVSIACFFTPVALFRPHGPQPAAYGHLQTLANLVDEWSWGHKEDGIPYCHAETSNYPLPPVKMNCVYTGCSIGPLHPSREQFPSFQIIFLDLFFKNRAGEFMPGDVLTMCVARCDVEWDVCD
ncbi:hypothetical protein M405DRAFT_408540 [Rhizopogon salebrosus TDB-379]|nr:hypothetical protein M405DRAFT_408540 [Rhizopogon salebrosus TDB-379]